MDGAIIKLKTQFMGLSFKFITPRVKICQSFGYNLFERLLTIHVTIPIMNTITFSSITAGSLLSGVVADLYGRKPVVLGCLCGVVVFSTSCYFVENVWQLICTNVLLGASSCGCYFTLYVFHQEIVTPSFRNVSSSLILCAFSLSFLLVDLVAYFERHWRHLQLYLPIPSLLSILVFCYVPESPRWCLSKGNVQEANRFRVNIYRLPRQVLGKNLCPPF